VTVLNPAEEQRVLGGDLGGRAASHSAADLAGFDHRDALTAIFEQPRCDDPDDAAADDRDIDFDWAGQRRKRAVGCGAGPITPVGAGRIRHRVLPTLTNGRAQVRFRPGRRREKLLRVTCNSAERLIAATHSSET
jgi:hypothetical protein